MGKILQWIIGYAIVRAAVHIGVGVATYGGVVYAITSFIGYARDAYSGLPVATLQFAALAGVPEFLAIICGAVIARMSIQFTKRLALIG